MQKNFRFQVHEAPAPPFACLLVGEAGGGGREAFTVCCFWLFCFYKLGKGEPVVALVYDTRCQPKKSTNSQNLYMLFACSLYACRLCKLINNTRAYTHSLTRTRTHTPYQASERARRDKQGNLFALKFTFCTPLDSRARWVGGDKSMVVE